MLDKVIFENLRLGGVKIELLIKNMYRIFISVGSEHKTLDMSLLATSYRYEIENCNAKSLQKAFARQDFRIKVSYTTDFFTITQPKIKIDA